MALLFDSWLVELGAVLIALFSGIYIYMTLQFQYWKKKGLPYIEPSFPFGNVGDMALQRTTIGEAIAKWYWKLEDNKMGGVYRLHKPVLLVKDPELIKSVLVKDFASFHDHGLYYDGETDPLSGHLFFLEGIRWKHMRYKLTPTFTSGKMKMMFPTIVACGNELRDYLAPLAKSKETIEVKDIFAKFGTDVIASCAFGIESNCLKNPDSEFRNMGRKAFQTSPYTIFRDLLTVFLPRLAEMIKISRTPRDVTDFFIGLVKETIEYREKFQVTRNDFMQLLIGIKNKKNLNDPTDVGEQKMDDTENHKMVEKNMYDVNGITTEELAAQAFSFYTAGFETSSTTVSFCLYELALNQGIQDRLRDEMDSVMADHEGQLTYEAIVEMEYLDMVVAETLRKYPSLPALNRDCNKDCKLPGTDTEIERGTPIFIPVYALHHDPQYYPNPEEFNPDRFTEEAKSQRHHYVYLPFGEGPRICIGSRFGLMQAKVGIFSIISNYQINVCKKKTAIPLVLDKKSFIMAAKGGMHLQITERVHV